jgi:hypothetical protein
MAFDIVFVGYLAGFCTAIAQFSASLQGYQNRRDKQHFSGNVHNYDIGNLLLVYVRCTNSRFTNDFSQFCLFNSLGIYSFYYH